MSEDTYIWEQIDRYLGGDMQGSEREAFEASIEADSHLAEQVEASKVAAQIVIGYEVLKLKEQMTKDLRKPNTPWASYGLGLMLLTALTGGIYLWQANRIEQAITPAVVHEKTVTNPEIAKVATSEQTNVGNAPQAQSTHATPAQAAQEVHVPVKAQEKTVVEEATASASTTTQQSVATTPKEVVTSATPAVQNTPKETQKEQSLVAKNDCEGRVITMEVQTTASCKGGQTGAIHIKKGSIHGGHPPYSIGTTMDHFAPTETLDGLEAGTYKVYLKDAKACILPYGNAVVIKEIVCKEPDKEFTYNLSYDPSWTIPYQSNKTAKTIKILDKSGREVYHAEVRNGTPADWNGDSNTGLSTSMGYHMYFIEYTDGSIEKGTIMIVQ